MPVKQIDFISTFEAHQLTKYKTSCATWIDNKGSAQYRLNLVRQLIQHALLRKEISHLLVQPFHILLAISRASSPVWVFNQPLSLSYIRNKWYTHGPR